MAIGDVYGTRWQFRDHGVVWTFGLYYIDETGVPELDAANDLAVGVTDYLENEIDAIRGADSTREGVYAWKYTAATGMPDTVKQGSRAGTFGAATCAPPNICSVFSLRTTDPSAKRSGRIYMGGIPVSALVSGRFSAAYISAAEALATKLKNPIPASLGSYTPVILRKVSGGLPLVPPQVSVITNVTVSNIPYSQRRRNSKQIGFSL